MISFFPSREVAIEIFGFGVHWYGLLYLLGFAIGIFLLPRLQKYRDLYLSKDDWIGIVSWAALGVIIGGRLGYVLFYEPIYFKIHPREVFAVWNGGMSSHGGFIGVSVTLLSYCFYRGFNLRRIADTIVVPIAIGLALGRVGNFINQELYGTVTELPWGILVPEVEGLRHPVQLYGVIKDLLIAGICFLHLRSLPARPGRTFALFLMLYGLARFLVEFLRDQQYGVVEFSSFSFTRGQLLTLPILLLGILLWRWFGIKPEEDDE